MSWQVHPGVEGIWSIPMPPTSRINTTISTPPDQAECLKPVHRTRQLLFSKPESTLVPLRDRAYVANGMYGLILVQPRRDCRRSIASSVMQGDICTNGRNGEKVCSPSTNRVVDERPTYVVFNGSVGSLVGGFEAKPCASSPGTVV
jgi:hypothetical protein